MNPLFTIGVKCFNQAAFIESALEGAFAQTYRPLEIVVSDDGSTDGSWDIIGRVAARHRDMPGVSVVLSRNECNLGNMGNWMRIGELAHGEWIVKADGDDISEPTRVERIADAIAASDGSCYVVLHGATKIDPDGRTIGAIKVRYASAPLGAVMAFRRDCFTAFPPPKDGRLVDDEIFSRRALMLGGELNIPEPLVRYRVGTGISSGLYDIREPEMRCVRQLPHSIAQSLADLDSLRGRMAESEMRAWRERLESDERAASDYLEFLTGATFAERWRVWHRLRKPAPWRPGYFKLLAYLLPRRAGDFCLRILGRLRYG
jgi:glycosyltransferase involved in cell wall biosynthesis